MFRLYLVTDYKRLKSQENNKLSVEWNVSRELSKVNYRIHTDAVKQSIINQDLTNPQINRTYAAEADMLNVALFNMTAKQWRSKNPNLDGNIRDYASAHELVVLANLESYNSILLGQELPQSKRIVQLRELARQQLSSLAQMKLAPFKSKEVEE